MVRAFNANRGSLGLFGGACTLALLIASGCESPRARSCRALVLAAEDCDAARAWSPAKVSPGVSRTGVVAARNESAARWLRTMEKPDADLRTHGDALATAMDRRGSALRGLEAMQTSLQIVPHAHGDTKSDDGSIADSMQTLTELGPHVEVLLRRCMSLDDLVGKVRQAPALFPECEVLAAAGKTCLEPPPDTALRDHLAHCAAEVAEVKSDDPATSAALRALTRSLDALTPFAAHVAAPADEVLRQLRGASEVSRALRASDEAADASAMALRKACKR